ncbi:MAG: type I-U CRISPR-associated protein Cas5/Cas6 [Candidatus Eisenbacteria bacterium]|nr:type I-U CRISPR-associated protein Cas5/Cas6 [Candidatus Eisenbacteria bacterium]
MLALEVNFLTGRFVATQFNDRRRGEWPPHPARLFSTLVAACHASEPADPTELAALDWLAAQGAPKVSASTASERELYTVFVPVNDPTVVGDFESARDELVESAQAVETARAKARSTSAAGAERELSQLEKQHTKLSTGILGRIEKAIAARTAMSSGDVKRGQSMLPEQRVRQARTFPSVSPDEPRVTFIWDDSKPDAAVLEALDRIAARVVRLGHSSTLVSVRLTGEAPSPNWIPSDDGEVRLRIPLVNQLALLTEAFTRHRETEPRVMPSIPQRYGAPSTGVASTVPSSIFDETWIILRRAGELALPCTAGRASRVQFAGCCSSTLRSRWRSSSQGTGPTPPQPTNPTSPSSRCPSSEASTRMGT